MARQRFSQSYDTIALSAPSPSTCYTRCSCTPPTRLEFHSSRRRSRELFPEQSLANQARDHNPKNIHQHLRRRRRACEDQPAFVVDPVQRKGHDDGDEAAQEDDGKVCAQERMRTTRSGFAWVSPTLHRPSPTSSWALLRKESLQEVQMATASIVEGGDPIDR